jgi:hypothetical protein
MEIPAGLGWLHISDLHVGMTAQGWMWPTLKTRFLTDLDELYGHSGPWDFVLFSGDLSQRGDLREFDRLTGILQEIWAHLETLGSKRPILFCVPGNHDLLRPDALDPEARVLRQWWNAADIHADLFENDSSRYRAAVRTAFLNYNQWLQGISKAGIPVGDVTRGILPGDCSVTLASGSGERIGLVGLNSAWLQVADGEFEGRLHVDTRQLLAVTSGDSDRWCSANTYNLLITHHPAAWLHETSLRSWNAEINPPARFDAHAYGHMHEPDAISLSSGGGKVRTSIQAASLFGLETFGTSCKRIHGYSSNRIHRSGSQVILRSWPRIAQTQTDGSIAIVPNYSFTLDERQSYQQVTREVATTPHTAQVNELLAPTQELTLGREPGFQHYLSKTELVLAPQPAHLKVRSVEQQLAEIGLTEERKAWLYADWGMGEDGFLWSIIQAQAFRGSRVFRLDLAKFSDQRTYVDGVAEDLGCSFGQYCELLSRAGKAFLILDDVQLSGTGTSDAALVSEVNSLVEIVLQYCPAICAVLLVHQRPTFLLSRIELRPLDEADTRAYIEAHPLGGPKFSSASAATQLFRHTDGVPSRIDSALKELEVTSITELLTTNSDATAPELGAETAPEALLRSIAELSDSQSDRILQRSFSLLKTLSMFPQGEQLLRIKRFLGPHPYLPAHARELLDRGLIDAIPVLDVGEAMTGEIAKTLVVRRPVRDYVRSLMNEEEQSRVNEQALDLYFGDQWRNATYKSPASLKFSDPRRGVAEISNASMVIVRLLRSAVSRADERRIGEAIGAAVFYASKLRSGGHYRGVISLYEDVHASAPDGEFLTELSPLRQRYAESLRMIGERKRAMPILKEIAEEKLPKRTRIHVLLDLAFCYESEKDLVSAAETAREIISLDSDSSEALQAEAILLAQEDASSELDALETRARSRKAHVVANNVALKRANALPLTDVDGIRERLHPVLSTAAQSGDHYNLLRARLRLTRAMQASGAQFGTVERLWLIGAYQYLYNQRLRNLFDECHGLLWDLFETARDETNLLRLFRHSSLVWRLEGRERVEAQFVKRLAAAFAQRLTMSLREADRETAYFLTRMHAAMSAEGGQRVETAQKKSRT